MEVLRNAGCFTLTNEEEALRILCREVDCLCNTGEGERLRQWLLRDGDQKFHENGHGRLGMTMMIYC